MKCFKTFGHSKNLILYKIKVSQALKFMTATTFNKTLKQKVNRMTIPELCKQYHEKTLCKIVSIRMFKALIRAGWLVWKIFCLITIILLGWLVGPKFGNS